MVTHPYMGDYFDNIEVKAAAPTDLGYVHLTPKSKLLSEVIVKADLLSRSKAIHLFIQPIVLK
jgi:hypothetical protein